MSAADVLSQVFEHGRGVLLKLHPLHAPLRPHLESALGPLVEAGLLAIVEGGADVAQAALAAAETTHVHVTGGEATFRAIVWGSADPGDRTASPRLSKPITCELGNVTPWFILPGRYSRAELAHQADLVAASIANNTSFNCIATKGIVTCRSWPQRADFLALVERRLASLPARPGWYPGAVRDWEGATGRVAPADGTLPCSLFTGVDTKTDDRLLAREWFVPVVAEVPLDADDLAGFCGRALAFSHRLPGSLAASVTIPTGLSAVDARHAEDFVDHLVFGVVAVNTWSALAALPLVRSGVYLGGGPNKRSVAISVPGDWPPGDYRLRIRLGCTEPERVLLSSRTSEVPDTTVSIPFHADRCFIDVAPGGSEPPLSTHHVTAKVTDPKELVVPLHVDLVVWVGHK